MNHIIEFSTQYGPTIKAVMPWVLGTAATVMVVAGSNLPKYFGSNSRR